MDSYADRINRFNDMVTTTADHIKAVQDAATKFKDTNDPVGLGLDVTTAASGGIGSVAGAINGINHFRDFKTMYKGLSSKLSGARNRINTDAPINNGGRGGDANNPDNVQNVGGNAADDNAPNVQAQGNAIQNANQPQNNGNGGADIDGGLQDRIDDLENNPFPTEEANEISNAINQKVNAELGPQGRQILNNATQSADRGNDAQAINQFPEGDLKVAAQKDFLNFKNKVANDSIQRSQSGNTQASGYDNAGNPTGNLPGPEPNPGGGQGALQQVPNQNNVNPVQADNQVNLAPDPNAQNVIQNAAGDNVNVGQNLDEQAQGIVARGRAALQNLMGGQQVPGQGGQQVQGLRVNMPGGQNDVNAQANAGARIQQQAGDNAQNQLAPGRNPNGANQNAGNQPGANVDGNNNGQNGVNPGQGANQGGNAADDMNDAGINAARNIAGDGTEITEGLETAGDIATGLDTAAAFSGPAAPIIGVVSGLITLGTTIAGLFHHKPAPQKIAPPPPPTSSVGGNLKDSLSGMGGGIF